MRNEPPCLVNQTSKKWEENAIPRAYDTGFGLYLVMNGP